MTRPPTLYVAITNHGFGHATRTSAVVAEIQRRCPEINIILATTAPQWLLKTYLHQPVQWRHVAFDVGVLQSDSLTMDYDATLAALKTIQAQAAETIAAEAEFLKMAQVDLVLADIPPLAVSVAHAAGVPCWMLSNFGWDFIYRPWGGEFTAIADWISDCFQGCDRLFRLPFHEPMAAFPHITDVGLTGGDPAYDLA
ncbi:MAG: glycosyl transferase, partial [Cyanobacteria bacterium]|nr:glycosyl transferase [Cyanobacteriota bacterium]